MLACLLTWLVDWFVDWLLAWLVCCLLAHLLACSFACSLAGLLACLLFLVCFACLFWFGLLSWLARLARLNARNSTKRRLTASFGWVSGVQLTCPGLVWTCEVCDFPWFACLFYFGLVWLLVLLLFVYLLCFALFALLCNDMRCLTW